MLIKIAFFDKYVDTKELVDILKIELKVVSKEPIFSSNIRLRKKRNIVYTYNMDRYSSSIGEFCYGMLYTIDINDSDFEWLDYILKSYDYIKDEIKVTTIETSYELFLKNKFKIKSKSVACLCYTTNKNKRYQTIYDDRHSRVHFHKSFLLNIL